LTYLHSSTASKFSAEVSRYEPGREFFVSNRNRGGLKKIFIDEISGEYITFLVVATTAGESRRWWRSNCRSGCGVGEALTLEIYSVLKGQKATTNREKLMRSQKALGFKGTHPVIFWKGFKASNCELFLTTISRLG